MVIFPLAPNQTIAQMRSNDIALYKSPLYLLILSSAAMSIKAAAESLCHQRTTDEILQHLILVTLKLTSFTSDCDKTVDPVCFPGLN